MKFNDLQETNSELKGLLGRDEYFSSCRVGGTDYDLANAFDKGRPTADAVKNFKKFCGYYDKEDDPLRVVQYIETYKKTLARADLVFVGNVIFINACKERNLEDPYFDLLKGTVKAVHLYDLIEEFWKFDEWFGLLEGRKVLVLSPFKDTILQQFAIREQLFSHLGVRYPDFQLSCIRTPITYNCSEFSCEFPHEHFFQTVDSLSQQIRDSHFDIALVGCGGYSMPLISVLQDMRKSHLMLASMLQMYFGIAGRRWETPFYRKWMNEHWVRPLASDRPKVDEALFSSGATEALGAYF